MEYAFSYILRYAKVNALKLTSTHKAAHIALMLKTEHSLRVIFFQKEFQMPFTLTFRHGRFVVT